MLQLPRETRYLKGQADGETTVQEGDAGERKIWLDVSSSGKPPKLRKKRLRVGKPGFSLP